MSAHPQGTDVIEKNDSSHAIRCHRWREQGSYHHVIPTWLAYNRATIVITLHAKLFASLRHGSPRQLDGTGDDHSRWLPSGMCVDYAKAFHCQFIASSLFGRTKDSADGAGELSIV